MKLLRAFYGLCKNAALAWNNDNVQTLGAAVAYYTIFSLAPLLLIAIVIAGLFVSESEARSSIVEELHRLFGRNTAESAASLLDNAHRTGESVGATIIGLVVLLIGASGVFVQLQAALNIIWKAEKVEAQENFLVLFLKQRLFSFLAVLLLGILLLASVLVSSVLTALNNWVGATPLLGYTGLWRCASILVSFAFITLLFALIFKLLPDVPVAWRDVWIGALLTAFLFSIGQHAISFYLVHAGVASAYGAAGSLVALLVWVYYSAQIVLFGAEFTHAFAMEHGSRSST